MDLQDYGQRQQQACVPVQDDGKRYLLMVENGQIPTRVHYTLDQARAEAERLCQKERKKVYLFGVIDEVMIVPAPVMWRSETK